MIRFRHLIAALLLVTPTLALAQTAPTYSGQDGQTKEALGTFPIVTSSGGITPVIGSLVNAVVGKVGAANLYSVEATTGATALYLYVFNATAAPADGAVVAGTASGNYQFCAPIAVTTRAGFAYEAAPEAYSVGAVAVLSSTACGTLTKNATAVFIKIRVK